MTSFTIRIPGVSATHVKKFDTITKQAILSPYAPEPTHLPTALLISDRLLKDPIIIEDFLAGDENKLTDVRTEMKEATPGDASKLCESVRKVIQYANELNQHVILVMEGNVPDMFKEKQDEYILIIIPKDEWIVIMKDALSSETAGIKAFGRKGLTMPYVELKGTGQLVKTVYTYKILRVLRYKNRDPNGKPRSELHKFLGHWLYLCNANLPTGDAILKSLHHYPVRATGGCDDTCECEEKGKRRPIQYNDEYCKEIFSFFGKLFHKSNCKSFVDRRTAPMYTKGIPTTVCEVFNSIALYSRPKHTHFRTSEQARLYIPHLDWNANPKHVHSLSLALGREGTTVEDIAARRGTWRKVGLDRLRNQLKEVASFRKRKKKKKRKKETKKNNKIEKETKKKVHVQVQVTKTKGKESSSSWQSEV